MRKLILTIVTALLAVSTLSLATATPAQARKHCVYTATNGFDWSVQRDATARRMSTACRRAKRRCNRHLRRAKRRREIPRGNQRPVCRRIGEASAG